MSLRWVGETLLVAGLLAAIGLAARSPASRDYLLGAYATDLSRRTPHQRFNARRAAARLDGVTLAPGQVFSFNRRVRGWSSDQGYLPAPVSFDGALVDAYGGGVCETSTTVYNAALLAGLPILERHAHTFAPGYVSPGRDAAVAWPGVDLRFRNDDPFPLTLRVRCQGSMLVCAITSFARPSVTARVSSRILDRFDAPPERPLVHRRPGSRWRLRGKPGFRVMVVRQRVRGGRAGPIEILSDDSYLPLAPS